MQTAMPIALKGSSERYTAPMIDPMSVPNTRSQAEDHVVRRVA